jgi:hypothetical protein|tara:strand:+ start:539 stop:1051 length:513 start_codon:yes stop_codon:yes gene_type:complete
MIDPKELRTLIIEPTLREMEGLWKGIYSEQAVNLLIGIVFQESTIGGVTHLKQVKGPALGIYQIEPETHTDLWETYLAYRPDKASFMRGMIKQHSAEGEEDFHQELIYNLKYATAVARLKVWRVSFKDKGVSWPKVPTNVWALGEIWDKCYNANPEKGTVIQFVNHYPKI